MITYKISDSKNLRVKVYSDGALAGRIISKHGLYQYFPKGSKDGGDPYETLKEVKESLEVVLPLLR